jgi:hypothetical protein
MLAKEEEVRVRAKLGLGPKRIRSELSQVLAVAVTRKVGSLIISTFLYYAKI